MVGVNGCRGEPRRKNFAGESSLPDALMSLCPSSPRCRLNRLWILTIDEETQYSIVYCDLAQRYKVYLSDQTSPQRKTLTR